jgi:signal transduction histidine kinase
MQTMLEPHRQEARAINRKGWTLWFAAFALIIAFATTVHVLNLRLMALLNRDNDTDLWIRNGYYTGIGLAGLVLLFILYTALKQIQLQHVTRVLSREEAELEDVTARLSEISALFQLATTLNLRIEVDDIVGLIVRRVVATLRAQQASIMLYDPKSEMLETRAYYGVEGEFASQGKRRIGEGIAGWVAERQEAVLLNDAAPADMKQFYKSDRNISSALSVPLCVDNRCVGVLNVNRINHPEPFTDRQKEILRIFAEHIGTVIQRAQIMNALQAKTHDLEQANTRLAELNRMKDVFLSTDSHELKTPLTSVIAYAEVLTDHADTLTREQNEEFLGRLRTEAERLMNLIEDILDVTRIETGKVELKRQSLLMNQVTHTAVQTARPMAEKYEIDLVEEFSPDVDLASVDEVKFRQALVNLIVNAIKFSPKDGTVCVRTRLDADDIVIEVVDQGPGVAPEDISQIFTLFGQSLRGKADKAKGLGIGLHLVKALVEMHGGRVGVDSTVGAGSVFWIRIRSEAAGTLGSAKAA